MKIQYPHWTGQDTLSSGVRHGASARVLVEAIMLTSEVCGRALSPAAAEMLASDLSDFEEGVILEALSRCRMELQGPLRATEILARINDGRPEADEAWAMMPTSELASVVWTNEMARSWGNALPLLDAGDVAHARITFCESYNKAVLEARIRREPPRWIPSLGSDVAGRERVLLDALNKGRLAPAHVEQLLPAKGPMVGAEAIIEALKLKSLH